MYKYQRIRDLREDNDLTQTEIAKKLGTTQRQYSRWETGAQEFPTHLVIKLADIYKVTTDYLLGRTEDPHRTIINKITIHQRDNGTNNITF